MKRSEVFALVFSRPFFLTVALCTTVLFLLLVLIVPNAALLGQYLAAGTPTVLEKLTFAWTVLEGSLFFHGQLVLSMSVIVAGLLGVQVALLWYYTTSLGKRRFNQHTSLGALGGVAGLLGIGCVSCGSVLLYAALSVVGATGLLTLLPYHGAELGLVAIALLVYSINSLLQKLRAPSQCDIS